MTIEATLQAYATERQKEYLQAIKEMGSHKGASESLGVSEATIARSLRSLRRVAALQGLSPAHDMTHTVPEGYMVKGVSTYYDEEGKVRGQWVKSSVDDEARLRAIQEAVEALVQDIPRAVPIKNPGISSSHLATLYTLTDCHVGMAAWAKEGGADWNLQIAEDTLVGCFAKMVDASPTSAVGLVNQLGDFLHYDSAVAPVTPTHGHVLDADGSFSQMVAASVRILRRIIDLALAKHEKVVVLLAEGNHDIGSSAWLRILFKTLYENEPRIQVLDSELPYYVYQHGQTLLAFHHGHLKKNEQLPLLFAAQYPKEWGNTVKRYAHCGHRHHQEVKEHAGMVVEQHPTLAARDAYAARGGWLSERAVSAITYHSDFGQVAKITVTPEMLG